MFYPIDCFRISESSNPSCQSFVQFISIASIIILLIIIAFVILSNRKKNTSIKVLKQ